MILPDSRFVLPCPRMLLTDEKCERERERESFIRNNLHNGVVHEIYGLHGPTRF